jgi:putative transposase
VTGSHYTNEQFGSCATLPDQAEYEPTWKLLGQQPDGTLLPESENELMPVTGYINFSEAAHAITDYIVGITAR